MVGTFPTLLVSRRPRPTGVDWSGARSRLGGAPRLGATAWPRDERGEPLHFVAQIDLADVAHATGGTPLPAEGSLAFFIGRGGAVIFVPEGQGTVPVHPPADTPDLVKFGASEDWRHDLGGRPLYPYWPVRLSALDLPPPPEDEDDDRCAAFLAAQIAAVERHCKRREYNLSPDEVFAGAPRPQWWFMAIHYVERLQDAVRLGIAGATKRRMDNIAAYRKRLDALQPKDALAVFRRMIRPKNPDAVKLEMDIARTEDALAQLGQLEAPFKRFVAEMRDWTQDRDPWSMMQPAEVEQLDAQMLRAREEFRDFASSYAPQRRKDLETTALVTMASADDRGYAALPEPVRSSINRDYLLPAGPWHQMFGRGVEIQGNSCAMREEGYIMLLQLTYDDLMHWSFGDNGVYQFWIAPEALIRRNWSAARMTIECH